MPFHDNSLLFLTTLLVIQIYDLEYDSRCERHTGFAFKCLRRHMLLEICSKCEILLKCCQSAKKCLRGLKMQNSATNSKKCSKGAQRNRERSISELYAPFPSFSLLVPSRFGGNVVEWLGSTPPKTSIWSCSSVAPSS